MVASNLGQNNRCRALGIIPLTPWCAECSASRTSARSCLGIRILFSFMGTPSRQYNWSAIDQNCWIFDGSSWCDLGNPFCMYSANARHSSSVTAAATILSQVMALSLGSYSYADIIDAYIARSICWVMSILVTSLGFGDAGYLEVQSGAAFSFPGMCLTWNLYINERYLKVNRREFLIFSRTWSENILTSGWWSTVTNRSGHPNMNILQDSNPYIITRASPSIGE